jgi:hypothetical protein
VLVCLKLLGESRDLFTSRIIYRLSKSRRGYLRRNSRKYYLSHKISNIRLCQDHKRLAGAAGFKVWSGIKCISCCLEYVLNSLHAESSSCHRLTGPCTLPCTLLTRTFCGPTTRKLPKICTERRCLSCLQTTDAVLSHPRGESILCVVKWRYSSLMQHLLLSLLGLGLLYSAHSFCWRSPLYQRIP